MRGGGKETCQQKRDKRSRTRLTSWLIKEKESKPIQTTQEKTDDNTKWHNKGRLSRKWYPHDIELPARVISKSCCLFSIMWIRQGLFVLCRLVIQHPKAEHSHKSFYCNRSCSWITICWFFVILQNWISLLDLVRPVKQRSEVWQVR